MPGPRVRHGNPDAEKISTSYVKRQNLNMRRFTRLTSGFLKEGRQPHGRYRAALHALQLARAHKTLSVAEPTTPAMAAGVADRVYSLRDIASLLNA